MEPVTIKYCFPAALVNMVPGKPRDENDTSNKRPYLRCTLCPRLLAPEGVKNAKSGRRFSTCCRECATSRPHGARHSAECSARTGEMALVATTSSATVAEPAQSSDTEEDADDEDADDEDADDEDADDEAAEQARLVEVLAGEAASRDTSGAYPLAARACRWDGRCFQRSCAHWASFSHPRELAKAYCPELLRGGACRNHGAHEHNEAYSHGPLPLAMRAAAASGQPPAAGLAAAAPGVANLKRQLESFLTRHARELFTKQHRSANSFALAGDFTVGTGSTNPGFICHFNKGLPGFVKHPVKNVAYHVRPVDAQLAARKISQRQWQAYELARQLLETIDADYAAGEFLVQFALMDEASHRVGCHEDSGDVSYQYALALGDFSGAVLRCFTSRAKSAWVDLDTKGHVAKFDGRLPHEVVTTHDFRGQRFTVIVYKNYDHRKQGVVDAVFQSPQVVA